MTDTSPSPTLASGFERDIHQELREAAELAALYGLEFVDMDDFRIDNDLFRSVPMDLMLRYGFVPESLVDGRLSIVVSDPTEVTRIDELDSQPFDYVVTVCDHASESCPVFPAANAVVHVAFDDPPALVPETATETDALPVYRRVRDEIRAFVEGLPGSLPEPKP